MIVNTETGEILSDTYPLRYKPQGHVSRPKHSYRKRRPDIQLKQDLAIAVVVSAFLLGVYIAR